MFDNDENFPPMRPRAYSEGTERNLLNMVFILEAQNPQLGANHKRCGGEDEAWVR